MRFWWFSGAFVFALVFYRLTVYLKQGSVSALRAATGFKFHHYHYGILILAIALILILFHSQNWFSIALAGFGLGSVMDGFLSSLFKSGSRVKEIANYDANLWPTVLLFLGVVLIAYLVNKTSHNP